MVFEVRCHRNLSRVYIIDPSVYQFYRIIRLNDHVHFQLRGSVAVEAYIVKVHKLGLMKINPSAINETSNMFYTVLNAKSDQFLPEISVINSITLGTMKTIVKGMDLNRWGRKLASSYECGSSSMERRNKRFDIGFAAQSHNDPDVIPGMNVPKFTTKHDSKEGLEEKETLTMSLMRSAILMKRLVNELKDKYELDWDDFNDEERRNLFANRAAKERGVADGELFVYKGVSVGVTGSLQNGEYLWLRPHVDKMNGRQDGYDVYHGFSIHIRMHYIGFRHPVLIRVSLGGYGKKPVDDCLSRLAINRSILNGVLDWQNNNPELFEITSSLLKFRGGTTYRTIRPRAYKSVYYSIFVEGLLRLGDMFHNDLGVLYEALFLMSLTPSPLGWFEGVMFAARNRGEENLVEVFINHMVKEYGCVSAGPGRRRQVSHGRSMRKKQLYASLINMKRCVGMASVVDDPAQLLKRWTSSPENGGLHGVGELIGQEQISVLSYLRRFHARDRSSIAYVAKSTATYLRLVSLGVKKDSHMKEILRFVMVNMGVDADDAEHFFCEHLRDKEQSKFEAKDTIIMGQGLYSFEDNRVCRMNEDGGKEFVEDRDWSFGRVSYRLGNAWWEDGFETESLEGELLLSTKKRKGRSKNKD